MATSEQEIFDRLASSLKAAADACDNLAARPHMKFQYTRLRSHLRLIEGAARQAAHWREDARWLKVGLDAAEAHARAGSWLRSHTPRKYFTVLATSLRKLQAAAERLKTAPTGRVGVILPPNLAPRARPAASMRWTATASGLLIPQAEWTA